MIRNMHELAIRAARHYQSEQTGFIHTSLHSEENDKQDVIPLFENFLFVLALFRSRIADNMTEAKNLLEKLLHFQSFEKESGGNFPLYLHQYPTCYDRVVACKLLPVFFWIEKEFFFLFKPELKEKFEKAHDLLQKFCLEKQEERPFSYPWNLLVAAATKKEELKDFLQEEENPSWWETDTIAWTLVSLQMVDLNWEREWTHFWDHLLSTWHQNIFSYIGPFVKESFFEGEPKPGFYDLWMGFLQGEISHRALTIKPFHLLASLIRPVQSDFYPPRIPYTLEGEWEKRNFRVVVERNFAFSLIEKKEKLTPQEGKTFTPITLLYGDKEYTHSFVCQGDDHEALSWKQGDGKAEILFTLSKHPDLQDKKKNREILFFVDQGEQIQILIEGKYANTFFLNQEVMIRRKNLHILLKFSLENGEGDFIGHIMPGNRPGETGVSYKKYQAFDWQIFLRTLRRSEDCQIKVSLSYFDSSQ